LSLQICWVMKRDDTQKRKDAEAGSEPTGKNAPLNKAVHSRK
jgi:hypothetical protein